MLVGATGDNLKKSRCCEHIFTMDFFTWACLIFLVAYLIWYFLFTDANAALAYAEKFGRPVSDFAGKVVWITGASTGLGEAMAYELASVGTKLILTARSENLLQKVKDECLELSRGRLMKRDILVLPFDISHLHCHKENVEKAADYFGKIDVLINNAARFQIGPIEETDMEVHKDIFDVNFFGPVSLTKEVIKQFLKQGKGHIAVISSIAGKFGVPSTASYCATKHALHGYFDTLRLEHSKDKISVSVICPGIFSSSIFEKTMTTKKGELFQKDYTHYECSNMTAERCAHLTLVAAINKQFESWVSYQPVLLMMWASQYVPDILRTISLKMVYTKERIKLLNNGIWPSDIPVWKPLRATYLPTWAKKRIAKF